MIYRGQLHPSRKTLSFAFQAVAAWFGDLQKYGVPENNVFTMNVYTTLSKYSQVGTTFTTAR